MAWIKGGPIVRLTRRNFFLVHEPDGFMLKPERKDCMRLNMTALLIALATSSTVLAALTFHRWPEPAILLMIGTGCAVLAGYARRRMKRGPKKIIEPSVDVSK